MLEEVAKLWKAEGGAVIVDDGSMLKAIFKALEGSMSGGRVGLVRKSSSNASRQNSFALGNDNMVDVSTNKRPALETDGRTSSFGMSGLHVDEPAETGQDEDDSNASNDPRLWLTVVSAFDQPRFSYDVDKKHFVPITNKSSTLPSPSHKTAIFKERYNVIHQRLLRNEAFQAPSFSANSASYQNLGRHSNATSATHYKLTPIANLLGRGGTSHLLFGQITLTPTGTLALNDPSGSIPLSLDHATPFQVGGDPSTQPYFCPGMFALIDGVYEEDWAGAGSSGLGNTGGVGGTIGGRFIGFNIGGPPVERRDTSLGAAVGEVGAGFGWTDFLGTGSERAIGTRMRRLERRLLTHNSVDDKERRKIVVLSEVTLDSPTTLTALRKVLSSYANSPPLAILLIGNFLSHAALSGARETDAIAYKEAFNELATLLFDFPTLLRDSRFIFVPGDNDPWASAFSAGAAACIPKESVPEMFTSRIKRAFTNAKTDSDSQNQPIWTTNPTRLTLFGPAHEVCVFRDNLSSRLRRSAVKIGKATTKDDEVNGAPEQAAMDNTEQDVVMSGAIPASYPADVDDTGVALQNQPKDPYPLKQAKRLILTLLPQSTLSPFPLSLRPTHWDYTPSALSLYPLPHTLVLADPEMDAFACVFEGCSVLNPGPLVAGKGKAGWIEYDCWTKRGTVRYEVA